MKYFHSTNQDDGKLYQQFCRMIEAIKAGKSAIMFAPLYVVMDQKTYQALIGNKPGSNKPPEDIILESGKDYRWENRL